VRANQYTFLYGGKTAMIMFKILGANVPKLVAWRPGACDHWLCVEHTVAPVESLLRLVLQRQPALRHSCR